MKPKPSKNRTTRAPAKRSFRVALRASSILGRIPSMIWAAQYLLLIPAFAVFYTLLPERSFYHSTLKYDAPYNHDTKLLERNIEQWATETITKRLGDAIERVEHRRPKAIRFYAGYGPDDFWPQLLASAEFQGEEQRLPLNFYLGGMVHATFNRDISRPELGIWGERSEGYELTADCDKEPVTTCKSKMVEQALKPDNYFVAWDVIWQPVYQLRKQAAGFNSGSDWHMFTRLLYLSAVTATTVGYGDIVPLTDLARGAVSVEAMLGVVLIGLFLNALAHEHSSSSDSVLASPVNDKSE